MIINNLCIITDTFSIDFAQSDGHILSTHGPENAILISFFTLTRLINITKGKVINEWPHINYDEKSSSVIHHQKELPFIAIANDNKIFFVTFDVKKLML